MDKKNGKKKEGKKWQQVQNNKEEISAVITTQAFFNGQNNEYMGILNLKFRMRFPIAESINWIQDKRKLGTNINIIPDIANRLYLFMDL